MTLNETKGEQELGSGEKVTDGYRLLSRPLRHGCTLEEEGV